MTLEDFYALNIESNIDTLKEGDVCAYTYYGLIDDMSISKFVCIVTQVGKNEDGDFYVIGDIHKMSGKDEMSAEIELNNNNKDVMNGDFYYIDEVLCNNSEYTLEMLINDRPEFFI